MIRRSDDDGDNDLDCRRRCEMGWFEDLVMMMIFNWRRRPSGRPRRGVVPGGRGQSLDVPELHFFLLWVILFPTCIFVSICHRIFSILTSFLDTFLKVFSYLFHPFFRAYFFMCFLSLFFMFQICSFRANPRRHAFYCSPLVLKRFHPFRKSWFFHGRLS